MQHDITQLNGLNLAYIGDSVYELMVREYILSKGATQVNRLHKRTVAIVCASGQSRAVEIILPHLTEIELSMYKRGRNAHGNNIPKNANAQDYRRATGFEALFGYLYLTDQQLRLRQLFDIIINDVAFD